MQKLTAMKFNERVTFVKMKPSSGFDPGEEEDKDLFSCWCYFKGKSVYDIQREVTTGLEDTINLYIRYEHTTQFDNKSHIRFQGNLYNIIKINPNISEKDFTLITAKLTN